MKGTYFKDICIPTRNQTRQENSSVAVWIYLKRSYLLRCLVLSSIDVRELFVLGLETTSLFREAHFIDLTKGLHHSPGSLRCSSRARGFITIITGFFTTHAPPGFASLYCKHIPHSTTILYTAAPANAGKPPSCIVSMTAMPICLDHKTGCSQSIAPA
jgi:hypothetical protein